MTSEELSALEAELDQARRALAELANEYARTTVRQQARIRELSLELAVEQAVEALGKHLMDRERMADLGEQMSACIRRDVVGDSYDPDVVLCKLVAMVEEALG